MVREALPTKVPGDSALDISPLLNCKLCVLKFEKA